MNTRRRRIRNWGNDRLENGGSVFRIQAVGRRRGVSVRERAGVVAIWLGSFPVRSGLSDYTRDAYDDEGEWLASPFAAEFGLGWYDHDRQETWCLDEVVSVSELLSPFSYSSSFMENATARAISSGLERANAAILLFDYEPQVEDPAGTLRYLGVFEYDRSAPTAAGAGGF